MTETLCEVTVRMIHYKGQTYLESRHRAIAGDPDGNIPKGKVLVLRTSLLPPVPRGGDGTEREMIDDDDAFRSLLSRVRCRRA